MEDNALTGIPSELGKLSLLDELRLRSNTLAGSIPSALWESQQPPAVLPADLEMVQNEGLTGAIPDGLSCSSTDSGVTDIFLESNVNLNCIARENCICNLFVSTISNKILAKINCTCATCLVSEIASSSHSYIKMEHHHHNTMTWKSLRTRRTSCR